MVYQNHELNDYQNTFEYYDLDLNNRELNDLSFYKKLIVGTYSEILELCCGTGRISVPLAMENLNVTAIDISEKMLSIFKRKIENNPVSKRITIMQANMVDFSLNRKFQCVLLPFHSFQILIHADEITNCLKNIYLHLEANGTLILNLFKPLKNMKDIEGITEVKTLKNKFGIDVCRKKVVNNVVDTLNQSINYTVSYEFFDTSKKTLTDHFCAKYYDYFQIEYTLLNNNFSIEKQYLGFGDSEISSDQNELTLICKKSLRKKVRTHNKCIAKSGADIMQRQQLFRYSASVIRATEF